MKRAGKLSLTSTFLTTASIRVCWKRCLCSPRAFHPPQINSGKQRQHPGCYREERSSTLMCQYRMGWNTWAVLGQRCFKSLSYKKNTVKKNRVLQSSLDGSGNFDCANPKPDSTFKLCLSHCSLILNEPYKNKFVVNHTHERLSVATGIPKPEFVIVFIYTVFSH